MQKRSQGVCSAQQSPVCEHHTMIQHAFHVSSLCKSCSCCLACIAQTELVMQSTGGKHRCREQRAEAWTIPPQSPRKSTQARVNSAKSVRSQAAAVQRESSTSTRRSGASLQQPQKEDLLQQCATCGCNQYQSPRSAAASPSLRGEAQLPQQPHPASPGPVPLAPASPPRLEVCSAHSAEAQRDTQPQHIQSPVILPPVPRAASPPAAAGRHATPRAPESGLKAASCSTAPTDARKPHLAVCDNALLQNPERQDMVSALEKALADLERDISNRASAVSSEVAPAFTSGLDSLAALEAEISAQHRRLADIGGAATRTRPPGGGSPEGTSTCCTACAKQHPCCKIGRL